VEILQSLKISGIASVHICDNLKYRLQRRGIPDPSDEQVYDYGLYLMEKLLKAQGSSSLDKFPPMPVSQMGWTVLLRSHLLMEQEDYDQVQQQQMADQHSLECFLYVCQ
jgi:hypothetical protein